MDDISSPRPLTEDEAAELKALLKPHLKLNNVSCPFQADADADDLLNYALDMIEDGENVGKVLEELEFMELEICSRDVAQDMREDLAEFLARIHKKEGKRNWRDMLVDNRRVEDDDSNVNSGPYVSYAENHVSVELSAKSAADKHKNEMAALFGSGANRAAASGRQSYEAQLVADRVDNKKERMNNFAGGGSQSFDGGGKSIDEVRREELMAVMNDRSLGKAEKAKRMDEIKAKYGGGSPPSSPKPRSSYVEDSAHDVSVPSPPIEPPKGGVDLSAKAAADKHSRELATLFGGGGGGGGIRDRMSIFNEKGEIIKNARASAKEREATSSADVPRGKTNDELRRGELMAIMKDKSLNKEEKARRMDEVRAKYETSAPPTASGARSSSLVSAASSFDSEVAGATRLSQSDRSYDAEDEDLNPLSAKAASEKNKKELGSLFGAGGVASARKAMASGRRGYEEQLRADRVCNKLGVAEAVYLVKDGPPRSSSRLLDAPRSTSVKNISRENTSGSEDGVASPSLENRRRAELRALLKDKSLSKEDRRTKTEEINKRYAALKGEEGGDEHPRVSPSTVVIEPGRHCSIDFSAKSFAERSKRDIENTVRSMSLSERKMMYNNQSTIVAGRACRS